MLHWPRMYSGHCLNMVIGSSCALPEVRNVMDILKKCCLYFAQSPKRNSLLEEIVQENVPKGTKRKALLDLCRTRWAARHTAYMHFYQCFVFIVEALEVIGYGFHLEKYNAVQELYADWDPKSKNDAQQILEAITSFSFIMVFLMVYQYLSHLSGITVQLQESALDVIKAYKMVGNINILLIIIFNRSLRKPSKACGRGKGGGWSIDIDKWYKKYVNSRHRHRLERVSTVFRSNYSVLANY